MIDMWHTKDLWLATYLEVLGYRASHVEVREDSVGYFVFRVKPSDTHLARWLNREASVEPLTFMQKQTHLKNMLFKQLESADV